MNIHVCTSGDMHPYECDGPGKCIHCDKTDLDNHDPLLCYLCASMDDEHAYALDGYFFIMKKLMERRRQIEREQGSGKVTDDSQHSETA